ncbi:MAG TPA: HAD-IA family hydrolase [Gemmataceae bacterium]|nr:HAD-IA family hydrolase [Gemmataceae bacterium]
MKNWSPYNSWKCQGKGHWRIVSHPRNIHSGNVHPLLQSIHVVVFDAVGTVIHPEPAAPLVYAEVGSRFGSKLGAGDIASRFKAAFQAEELVDVELGLRTNAVREIERWQRIVTGVLDDVTEPEACFRVLFDHFGRPEAWRCDPDAAPTMEALARQGYTLALASNYDRRLRSVVAGLPIEHLRHLVISSEVGWRKPAPQFFKAVCDIVRAPPERILHIGDDPVNDYHGARSAGMRGALLNRDGSAATRDVEQIKKLSELVGESAAGG